MAVRGRCELAPTRAKDQADLIVRRQKSLSLLMGFEPAHYLLSFAVWPVRHFHRVAHSFVSAVVSVRGECLYRFDVTAQLVRDDNPRFANPSYQFSEIPPCCLGIPPCLHKNF